MGDDNEKKFSLFFNSQKRIICGFLYAPDVLSLVCLSKQWAAMMPTSPLDVIVRSCPGRIRQQHYYDSLNLLFPCDWTIILENVSCGILHTDTTERYFEQYKNRIFLRQLDLCWLCMSDRSSDVFIANLLPSLHHLGSVSVYACDLVERYYDAVDDLLKCGITVLDRVRLAPSNPRVHQLPKYPPTNPHLFRFISGGLCVPDGTMESIAQYLAEWNQPTFLYQCVVVPERVLKRLASMPSSSIERIAVLEGLKDICRTRMIKLPNSRLTQFRIVELSREERLDIPLPFLREIFGSDSIDISSIIGSLFMASPTRVVITLSDCLQKTFELSLNNVVSVVHFVVRDSSKKLLRLKLCDCAALTSLTLRGEMVAFEFDQPPPNLTEVIHVRGLSTVEKSLQEANLRQRVEVKTVHV
jgi:hypothetical protein